MILKLLILLFFWRVGLLAVSYLGTGIFPKISNSGPGAISINENFDFWSSHAQWDGGHFLRIIDKGYTSDQDFAFFPLFPLLIDFFNNFYDNPLIWGLALTHISFVLFLVVFYKYLEKRSTQKTALASIITFITFPTTFFAVSLYSESLFLLFAALTFFFLSKKQFLKAAIAVSLASLTRLVGMTLAISLFYSYLTRSGLTKVKNGLLVLFLSLAGIVIYSLFLQVNFGDPFKYLTSQSFWQREVADPVTTVLSYLPGVLTFRSFPNDYLDLFLTLLFIVILIMGARKIPSSLWIFSLLVILIPASTGTLSSMPRYLLASLGVFAIAGQYFEKNWRLAIILWSLSLAAQAILFSLFLTGHWVA